MQMPMVGSWEICLHNVRTFTIHGDLYYEVQASQTSDPLNQIFAVRIPQHVLSHPPMSSEVWRVTFLMGQVTSAERVS